jgi:HEAT repeat protein
MLGKDRELLAAVADPTLASLGGITNKALQIAADLGRPEAVPLARAWLAKETSANMRAVAIGVLGRHGAPSDRALIEPFLTNPDPRLGGAAKAALGKKKAGKNAER